MIDSVCQRVSALYRWSLSLLRNFVVGRYRIHFANLRGLTPVRLLSKRFGSWILLEREKVQQCTRLRKSRVNYLSRDRVYDLTVFNRSPRHDSAAGFASVFVLSHHLFLMFCFQTRYYSVLHPCHRFRPCEALPRSSGAHSYPIPRQLSLDWLERLAICIRQCLSRHWVISSGWQLNHLHTTSSYILCLIHFLGKAPRAMKSSPLSRFNRRNRTCRLDVICKGLPEEFKHLLKYARALKFFRTAWLLLQLPPQTVF